VAHAGPAHKHKPLIVSVPGPKHIQLAA
jgi:hypothetical protein